MIIPDLQNPFYSGVASGVEAATYARDYAIILCNSNEDSERERFYLDVLEGESVDGIILPPIYDSNTEADLDSNFSSSHLPTVCFDRRPDAPLDTVVTDNRRGSREAVAHLVALGHRRIGAIFGPAGLSTSRERTEGYRQALNDHGIVTNETLLCSGPPTRAAGRAAAERLLYRPSRRETPTALFAANNQLVLGALEAISALGLRIPEDVALVGYDDPLRARLLATPLTTVRQPAHEIGRRAADLLLRRLADPDRPPTTVELDPAFIVRGSCGAKRTQTNNQPWSWRAPVGTGCKGIKRCVRGQPVQR